MKNTSTGVVFMILTILLFSIMNALAKGFANYYPIIVIVWVRYISQTIFTTFIFIPNLNKIVKTKKIKLHLFRSLLLFCATLSMFSGFKYHHFSNWTVSSGCVFSYFSKRKGWISKMAKCFCWI